MKATTLELYLTAREHPKRTTKNKQIKSLIGEVEDELQKDHDIRKIFYGTLSDLSSDRNLVKFISQNNKVTVMK